MKLNESECENTGLIRNCPSCNSIIKYSNKYRLAYAIRDETWCSKCWRFKRRNSIVSNFSKDCPQCKNKIYFKTKYSLQRSLNNNTVCHSCADRGNNGRIQSNEEKELRAIKLRGLKRSIENRQRISNSKLGNKNPKFGDHSLKSTEHKRKIRISCIEYIENKLKNAKKRMRPSFNPHACDVIDEYGKLHGYNFQHALNGGEFYIKELGYWVDGYDKSQNVVIEYFENNHWHRKNKKKDIDRCKEICQYLGCNFIILREEVGGNYLSEHIHKQKR